MCGVGLCGVAPCAASPGEPARTALFGSSCTGLRLCGVGLCMRGRARCGVGLRGATCGLAPRPCATGCPASGCALCGSPYARPVRIDLHTHSTASDGTDTPAELVGRAKAAGLDVVAITDHDTAAGWAEAAAALPTGLTLVPGTEFSCAWFGANGARIGLHLLGYLYDSDDDGTAV